MAKASVKSKWQNIKMIFYFLSSLWITQFLTIKRTQASKGAINGVGPAHFQRGLDALLGSTVIISVYISSSAILSGGCARFLLEREKKKVNVFFLFKFLPRRKMMEGGLGGRGVCLVSRGGVTSTLFGEPQAVTLLLKLRQNLFGEF